MEFLEIVDIIEFWKFSEENTYFDKSFIIIQTNVTSRSSVQTFSVSFLAN